MNSITFSDVTKRFGDTQALGGVSFTLRPGDIVGLLGPNGAGKTTALEILLGLRTATTGTVSLLGGSPRDARLRRRIGATPQNTGFPDGLRARELVAFVAAQYAHPMRVDETIDAFDLTSIADRRLGDLSGGQQRRVALALAFAGNPEVVVLDEPSTGLDVESRRNLWNQLRARADANRTFLFTTHYIEEAQALANRVLVIDRGSLLFDGSPSELRERFGHKRVQYVGPQGPVVATPPDADAYVRELVLGQTAFSDLQITAPSLEEAFLSMTGGAA